MTTTTLVERYFDAVNRHDWGQLVKIFHPDVTVQHGATLSVTGRERAIELLGALVAQFDEHHDRPTRVLVAGHVAAIEITFTGTRTSDGKHVSFDAVDIIDTDGATIVKVASWYDTAEVLPLLRD